MFALVEAGRTPYSACFALGGIRERRKLLEVRSLKSEVEKPFSPDFSRLMLRAERKRYLPPPPPLSGGFCGIISLVLFVISKRLYQNQSKKAIGGEHFSRLVFLDTSLTEFTELSGDCGQGSVSDS